MPWWAGWGPAIVAGGGEGGRPGGSDPGLWGGGENPKISDRWLSATSAPFSMILDVSGRSARVLFVSDVIFYIL